MTDRVLAWAMHAFPRRFRVSRGVEMRDTLADVLEHDHRRMAVVLAAVDMVFAGWRLRARTRPPLHSYLAFRLIEGRLAPEYHPWLFDHLQGWFRFRQPFFMMTLVCGTQFGVVAAMHGSWGDAPFSIEFLIFYGISTMIVANIPYFARRDRDRIMRRHGYVRSEPR